MFLMFHESSILTLPEFQIILPGKGVMMLAFSKQQEASFNNSHLGESKQISFWNYSVSGVFVSAQTVSALEFSVEAKPEPLWAVLHIVCFWQLDSERPRLGSKQYEVLIGLFYPAVAESADHHTDGVGSL